MKKGMKRVIAFVMALVMTFGIQMPQKAEAVSAEDRYAGEYGIEQLLSYYQYVTRGDCNIGVHTLGPVAVGGSLSSNGTIGDAAYAPSYAKHLVTAQIGYSTDYYATTRTFYYGTASGGNLTGFTQNANFMDLEANFPAIIAESEALKTGSVKATKDGNVLICDFNAASVYEITYSDLYAAKDLNIIINNVNDFKTKKCVINFTGVGSNMVNLDNAQSRGAENSYSLNVYFNGVKSGEGWKPAKGGLYTDGLGGFQCNLNGMKLIYNFPDATHEIIHMETFGHVVAPQAVVCCASGSMEGGVIAKEVSLKYGGVEAHFYPFSNMNSVVNGTGGSNESGMVQNIKLIKKFVDPSNGATMGQPAQGALFALYKDADCTMPVITDVEAVRQKNGEYVVTITGSAVSKGNTYYLKETRAAVGFMINDTVYCCRVNADGTVDYKKLSEPDSAYSSEFPECINQKEIQALLITVVDKDTKLPIADCKVEITKNGSSEKWTAETDENGKIYLKDIPNGDYVAKVVATPDAYKTIDGADSVAVNVPNGKTGTGVLELQKRVGDLVVEVTEKDNYPNKMQGATVTISGNGCLDQTVTIEADGTATVTGLPIGSYTVTVQTVPDKYNLATSETNPKTAVVVEDPTVKVPFVVEKKTGKITVVVNEYGKPDVKIPNASITISGNGCPDQTVTTGPDGSVTVDNLPIGDYNVKVNSVPDGYNIVDPDNKDATVTEGSDSKIPFAVSKQVGCLKVIVTEKDNATNKIANAVVTIVGEDYSNEVKTGPDGTVTVTNLPVGEYTVTINSVPGNYNILMPKSETKTVAEGTTPTEYPFYVEKKTGSLVVVITEYNNPSNKIEGAKVEIKDSNGTIVTTTPTVTTDENGQVKVEKLPIGEYTVTVKEVPGDYKVTCDGIDTQVVEETTTPTKYEFEVTKKVGHLLVTVTEQGDATKKIANAEVNVSGEGYNKNFKTNANGQVEVKNLPVGEYKVTVNSVPNNYKVVGDNFDTEMVNADATTAYSFVVTKKVGNLTVVVTEKNNKDNKIDCYKVTITGTDYEKTFETTNGDVTVSGLPVGKYTVKVVQVKDGYEVTGSNEKTLPVKEDQTTEYPYEVIQQKGNLKVIVTEYNNASNKIDGATVKVSGPDGYSTTVTTGKDGSATITGLPVGSYTVTVESVPGEYKITGKEQKVDVVAKNTTTEYPFEVTLKVGALQVIVTEKDNANVKVQDVSVTITGEGYNNTTKTDANGMVTVTNLPVGNYTVKVNSVPAVYNVYGDDDISDDVEEGKTTSYEFKVVKKTGSLQVTVTDERTNDPVPNAKLEIKEKDGKVVTTVTTNAEGKAVVENLPIGDYEVTIKEVPDEYSVTTDKTITNTVKEGQTTEYEYKVDKQGSLEIIIKDVEGTPIQGAEIEIVYPDGTKETVETDSEGKFTKDQVTEGNCTVTVKDVPNNYDIIPPSSIEKPIKPNEKTEYKFEITTTQPVGHLHVVITDARTGDKIAGAKVTVTGPDGYKKTDILTDSHGSITINGLNAGEYTVKVTYVPDDYTILDKDTLALPVKANQTTQYVYKVDKFGSLTIVVKDERTNQKVPHAELEVKDEKGNVTPVNTGDSGQVTLDNLLTGQYKVTVKVVPENYTVTSDKELELPVEAKKTTTYEYKIDTLGNMSIVVIDEKTGQKVPNAELEVKDSKGNKKPVTTGDEAEVNLTGLPTGKYTVTITKVPEEYTVTTNKVIYPEVIVNDTVTCEYKVNKLGSLQIVVRDERTNNLVPGAIVEVKDSEGNIVTDTDTVKTDARGQITISNLPVGDYQVTIKEVPNNYEVTTDEEITSKVEPNKTTEFVYKVDKFGNLNIIVKDDDGRVVPKAELEIEYPDGKKETVTTDENGKVELERIPVGEHKVTITKIPEGYTVTTDKEFTKVVLPNRDTVYEFEIINHNEYGNLSIVVTDVRDASKKVAGATVEIKDANDNLATSTPTVTTDADGMVLVKDLLVGEYTVTIKEVPDDYDVVTDTEIKATVEADKTAEYQYKVDKLGTLVIVVRDEKTNAVVPGADVTIKDATGNVIGTATTDAEGKVKKEKLPVGEYTVIIDKVPSGYTVSTNKELKNTVVAKKETLYEFKVNKRETTTNNNSSSAQSTPAPTTPPATTTTVTSNTPVNTNGVAISPKTGDEFPAMGVLIVMMMVGIGLVIVEDNRKKNKECK